MTAEATVVCSKCKRTVSEGMARALDPRAKKTKYVCRGLMARSCERMTAEKAQAPTK